MAGAGVRSPVPCTMRVGFTDKIMTKSTDGEWSMNGSEYARCFGWKSPDIRNWAVTIAREAAQRNLRDHNQWCAFAYWIEEMLTKLDSGRTQIIETLFRDAHERKATEIRPMIIGGTVTGETE